MSTSAAAATAAAGPTTRPAVSFSVHDLGQIGYLDGLRRQDDALADVQAGRASGALFLLEHPHVVTLGRNARRANVLVPDDELARRGVEIHECGRGGDVTYHGPGQLVGYPVMHLPAGRRDVHRYVRDIEEVLIRTLARFGVDAARVPGHPGVWVGRDKVAALGVRISRWITSHGFALNVDPELDYFDLIRPCGLRDRGVTSMARLLGAAPAMADVKRVVADQFRDVFSG